MAQSKRDKAKSRLIKVAAALVRCDGIDRPDQSFRPMGKRAVRDLVEAQLHRGNEIRTAMEELGLLGKQLTTDHPDDDNEPVDVQWLESVGWDQVDSCNWPSMPLQVNGIRPWPSAGIAWRGAGVWLLPLNVALCLATTRGDIRRLCAALGIELTHN